MGIAGGPRARHDQQAVPEHQFALEMTLLALQVVADAIWRWRDLKYAMRADGARSVQRWAHRHRF